VFSDAISWRHNKCNMADGRHIENRLLAISPRFIVRLTRNFVRRSTITFRHTHMTKIPNFENSRWRTAAILKLFFFRYMSAADHPISMKFGVPLQILVLRTAMWQCIKILQIQNGGRPSYWKSTLAISPRFIVRLTQNLVRRSSITFRHRSRDQNTRFWKFKMADGHALYI